MGVQNFTPSRALLGCPELHPFTRVAWVSRTSPLHAHCLGVQNFTPSRALFGCPELHSPEAYESFARGCPRARLRHTIGACRRSIRGSDWPYRPWARALQVHPHTSHGDMRRQCLAAFARRRLHAPERGIGQHFRDLDVVNIHVARLI
jgi:hypothetical protein